MYRVLTDLLEQAPLELLDLLLCIGQLPFLIDHDSPQGIVVVLYPPDLHASLLVRGSYQINTRPRWTDVPILGNMPLDGALEEAWEKSRLSRMVLGGRHESSFGVQGPALRSAKDLYTVARCQPSSFILS